MSAEKCKSHPRGKEEFWRHHIENCRQSDLSLKKYCNRHGLALSTFGYWKRQLAKCKQPEPRFYPLTLHTPPAARASRKDSGVSLYLQNDTYRVELSEEFSSACLKQLLSVLHEL